ncbi:MULTISPECIES: hypothetical protein [Pseudoalteromonas]|uniref:Uncharacterized protein n=1 Tax=Pseudoalteromonas luteoviolacea (strain 2ta16) TaxID=1353533 RepID=V4JBV7_PSEL2|nr:MULTISPECIES: hypothetical protein [Pseudoalteromonas]ESP92617.1 hypothetical protein PL2TA16_03815 [Pseudoalteromonas luteoviolacea 2ta16]KZN35424.1 hypothetical protein N483_00300 [Pseudoalteromonas luteoviolacea NCIMB 1944]MCG7546601.1 hypothetical protein [Pseudoalteromonas sp. Of7M-16]
MKTKINKKQLKNLSQHSEAISPHTTAIIAGGRQGDMPLPTKLAFACPGTTA